MNHTKKAVTAKAVESIMTLSMSGLTTEKIVDLTGYGKSTVNTIRKCKTFEAYQEYNRASKQRHRKQQHEKYQEYVPSMRNASVPIDPVPAFRPSSEFVQLQKSLDALTAKVDAMYGLMMLRKDRPRFQLFK